MATLNHNLPPDDHSTTFKSALGLHLKKNHLVHRQDLDLGNRWSDQAETCCQAGLHVCNDGPAVESQVWFVDGVAIPHICSSQAKIAALGEQTAWTSTIGGPRGPNPGCVRWPRLCPPLSMPWSDPNERVPDIRKITLIRYGLIRERKVQVHVKLPAVFSQGSGCLLAGPGCNNHGTGCRRPVWSLGAEVSVCLDHFMQSCGLLRH